MKALLFLLAVVFAVLLSGAVALQVGLLRAPVQHYISHVLQRPVAIASFRGSVISTTPWVEAKEIKIGNASWAGSAPLADIKEIKLSERWSNLLRGELNLAELRMDQGNINLQQQASGKANWTSNDSTTSSTLVMPPIHRFFLTQSHITINSAPRKLAFDGTLDSYEGGSDLPESPTLPFTLKGNGHLNGDAFALNLSGGKLVGTSTDKPYPFNFTLTHGTTHITAQGNFGGMFDFDTFSAHTIITGANLADLYKLTGLAFPLTRAYRLEGELGRNGSKFYFHNFTGKVGASDLNGSLDVDTSGTKPYLTAELNSKLLDPEDAGVIFGTPDPSHILPDVPLDVERLRAMDADVTYKADAINVNKLPLKQVSLKLKLKDAKLDIQPLSLTLPQGTFTGSLNINATQTVPDVDIDLKLSGARLEDFVATAARGTSNTNAIDGPLVGRVKLHGTGTSVHKAAGNADGRVALVVPNGHIREAFAQLLGINVAQGLGLLLSGNQQETPLRCAVADFAVEKGSMQPRHLEFDTGVVVAYGSGSANLNDESLDLKLKGESKEPSLLHVLAPITVTGHFRSPKLGVQAGGAAAQAGVAAGLAILNPLAAVLPFLDIGSADNANCGAILNRAAAHGVPLQSATPLKHAVHP